MASPEWNDGSASSSAFGRKGRVVTPSDTTDLDPVAKGIQVVGSG